MDTKFTIIGFVENRIKARTKFGYYENIINYDNNFEEEIISILNNDALTIEKKSIFNVLRNIKLTSFFILLLTIMCIHVSFG